MNEFEEERQEAGLSQVPVLESGQIDIDYLLKSVKQFIHETPETASKVLDAVSIQLIDIGLMANAKKTTVCTDWSTRWCPLHNDCLCGDDYESSEFHDDCPLHGNDTDHAFKRGEN